MSTKTSLLKVNTEHLNIIRNAQTFFLTLATLHCSAVVELFLSQLFCLEVVENIDKIVNGTGARKGVRVTQATARPSPRMAAGDPHRLTTRTRSLRTTLTSRSNLSIATVMVSTGKNTNSTLR